MPAVEYEPPRPSRAISSVRPSASRTVGRGDIVEVEWTSVNNTSDDAIITVLVRKRDDRAETILLGGVRVADIGDHQSIDWNTTDFVRGRYNVVIQIAAGDQSTEEVSSAIITINEPPTLGFTEPLTDTTLENDADLSDDETPKVIIRWSGSDPDGDGRMSLELDSDVNHDSGNEVVLVTKDLPEVGTIDSFEFTGNDKDSSRVDAGTYAYFARLTDGKNAERLAEGLARITVLEAPEPNTNTLAVTKPSADTSFVAGGNPIDITYTLNETKDVLIDLKIDTDDSHTTGNEQIILSQRLVSSSTREDTFAWDGNDSTGTPVQDGIYRVFILVNRGSGTPGSAQAEGLIFRRGEENKPLIAVIGPTSDQTVRGGQNVTVSWRDDDPSTTAKVFIYLDDDRFPQEATETGAAERLLLADRSASADDVSDTFVFGMPADLAPGTYYLFAYVDRDAAAPYEHSSVAAGRLIIADPNN
ncbi:MAG: hypothetical protein HZB38_18765 [Planctomycetes bacterium]|nr:hypothetical protein [Planctomycetota bacterium]